MPTLGAGFLNDFCNISQSQRPEPFVRLNSLEASSVLSL